MTTSITMGFRVSVTVLMVLCAAAGARAQGGRDGKWEIEVHLGGISPSNPDKGSSAMPEAGPALTTVVGLRSRQVSSWYFGDGAVFLNQVNSTIGIAPRITPIDTVLTSSILRRRSGVSGGFRVTRALSRRFAAELAFDYSGARIEMTDAALNAVEASRASFVTAWNGLMGTGPFAGPNVTAQTSVAARGGHQFITTGAVNVALMPGRRFAPYLTAGAGVVSNQGDVPNIRLDGNYRFRLLNAFPMDERDTITVRASVPDRAFAGVIGGGFKYPLSRRMGLRVDVRDIITSYKTETRLTASPSVTPGTPFNAIASLTNPSIQFSTAPGVPSTLGGSLADFRTFDGSGQQHLVTMSAGVFWRF